jgi:hypothetical protein
MLIRMQEKQMLILDRAFRLKKLQKSHLRKRHLLFYTVREG